MICSVIRTAQADAAHESGINDVTVTEAGRAEIYPNLGWADQVSPAGLVGKESHHQILQ